ncbi:MAG: DegT/DnrJ/EryC1/StrS family aminotransferase [Candidatus Nanopelagicales bacterium]
MTQHEHEADRASGPVPLVDLKAAHREVADEVERAMADVISRTAFVGGPDVAAFEEQYAQFSGVQHVIGVASGTDALEIPLRALGVAAGDEVIVPANTFIATAEAVIRAGGVPTYADVTSDALVDPASIEAAITPRTVGIAPVHLFGQMPDMTAIEAVADRHGLFILEDAAQAQGASQRGRKAGSIGVAAGTSFYPGKNLGAYGDAGAVLTNDAEIARKSRLMINHGSSARYVHDQFGFNSRLDTIQAVVLSAKLRRLADWNSRRQAAADRYTALLAGIPQVTAPRVIPGNEHVWHLYVIRVPERDLILKHLNDSGIGAGLHYPVPLHLTPALETTRFSPGQFPVAQELAGSILSLPLFPQITQAQQERVINALSEAMNNYAR